MWYVFEPVGTLYFSLLLFWFIFLTFIIVFCSWHKLYRPFSLIQRKFHCLAYLSVYKKLIVSRSFCFWRATHYQTPFFGNIFVWKRFLYCRCLFPRRGLQKTGKKYSGSMGPPGLSKSASGIYKESTTKNYTISYWFFTVVNMLWVLYHTFRLP